MSLVSRKRASFIARQGVSSTLNQITIVAEGAAFEGTVHAEGDLRVSGRIVGTLTVRRRAVVAPQGIIEGDLVALNADVAGRVEGDLDVEECLVLRSAAYVEGAIKTGRLVVEDGAFFSGACQMGQVDPPRRQAASPQETMPTRQDPAPPARPPAPEKPRLPEAVEPAGVGSKPSRPGGAPAAVPALPVAENTASARPASTRRTPATVGIVLVAVLGVALAAYLISGNGSKDTAGAGHAPPPAATANDVPANAAVASAEAPSAVQPAPVDTVPEAPDQAAAGEAVRQRALQERNAMERARRRIAGRRTEPEGAALYQQAEAARQTGTRQVEIEAFEQAARSFRTARDLFVQMQQALDEKDRALTQAEPPATDEAASEQAQQEAVLPAPPDVMTAVRRLAGYLKNSLEKENVGGMQALYYRGWEAFFARAEGISAVVRPENARVSGTQATVDLRLELAYQDAAQQPRQETRSYVWTLAYLEDEWVLLRVASQP